MSMKTFSMTVPHHQGAIDMANAELSYGKDYMMRLLAEEIIVDQQSEIDAMNFWLSKRINPYAHPYLRKRDKRCAS